MKLSQFNLWVLCLAVAVSALMIKLALILPGLMSLTVPEIFLGPLSGIVVDRHRGGSGVAGGVIAGFLSGLVLSATMNIYTIYHNIEFFSWFACSVSTIVFVIFEASCGWIWSRGWRSAIATQSAANSNGDGTWERK